MILDYEKAKRGVMDVLRGKVNTVVAVKVAVALEEAAVEAEPVMHAHWVPFIEDVEIYNGGGMTERRQTGWKCSHCGKGYTQFGHQRYCGDCGAKIDGTKMDEVAHGKHH
jgi:hypothetical protein